MNKITTEKLQPGMVFDKPVYLDKDNMLVEANVALTESDIERLKKWKITEILTEGKEVEPEKATTAPAKKAETTGDHSEQQADEVERAITIFKMTNEEKDNFLQLKAKAEKLIENAYGQMALEKPFQISRLRDLAEEMITMIDVCPYGFMFLHREEQASLQTHVFSTAIYAIVICNALDYSKPKSIEIILGVLMMDVGMLRVPVGIREKSEKLTDGEMKTLRAHPVEGYKILTQTVKVKNKIALIALQHSEHYDGTGYPRQTKGEEISEGARIASLADSYAALLEPKSYRKKSLPYEAIKELLTLGASKYDPNFMKTFLMAMSMYPVGSVVKLSDNTSALVIGPSADKPLRPILLTVREADGSLVNKPTVVHLRFTPDLFITRALDPSTIQFNIDLELESLVEKLDKN